MTTLQLIILCAVFAVCAFLILHKYILGPFLLRAKIVTPRQTVYEEISDEKAHLLFPPMFFETISELNAIGFSLACHLIAIKSPRTRTMVSLFVNRETKTMAYAGRVAVKNAIVNRIPVGFLEFNTQLKDGTEISTINTRSAHVFYDSPQLVVNRVPHLKDAAGLFRVHQYVVGQKASPAVLPEPGTEADLFREQTRRTLARQAELGYYFLDESGENYRMTWRGAFRSTFRLVWPCKQILLRRQERAGRRLAAEALRA